MRERIIKFLETENLAPTKFADEIGVQRSSISHILSGRNNPGFEFIQKILTRYKLLQAEWLIMGTGPMYKALEQGTLFPIPPQETIISDPSESDKQILKSETIKIEENVNESKSIKLNDFSSDGKQLDQIVMFYTDKTFSVYKPEK